MEGRRAKSPSYVTPSRSIRCPLPVSCTFGRTVAARSGAAASSRPALPKRSRTSATVCSSFWRRYDSVLRRAEAEYGVPPEYVVAIIGVETYFGRITGNYRVLDAAESLTRQLG